MRGRESREVKKDVEPSVAQVVTNILYHSIKILYNQFMALKFTDVVSKGDMIKISILIIVAIGLWIWVWTELQKPIIPEGLTDNYFYVEGLELYR